jgi:ribosome-binding protein aMBF1 (putative translation factor)
VQTCTKYLPLSAVPIAQEGTTVAGCEVSPMKICDICQHTVTSLSQCPVECANLEMCGDCSANILARFHAVEQRILEVRVQLRIEAVEAWRRERAPKPADV